MHLLLKMLYITHCKNYDFCKESIRGVALAVESLFSKQEA